MSGALNSLCLRLSFQGCLYTDQPWKTKIVSSSEAKDKLIYVLGR